jgi:hypothetical protein
MRRILCADCGKFKPTPPEDAARGLFPRRTYGVTISGLVCDLCGKELPKGSSTVAESIPSDMDFWEPEYLK